MSQRGRILLMCGAVVALVGAGGYYMFRVYAPGEDREHAQAEIERWETRFAKARDCLLGATPASSRPIEALALRELSPDPWDRGTCTRLISELSRGDARDTGLVEVEQAWTDLDKAASHVATGFITHVDPGGELPKNRGADPLPEALDQLYLAHAALRTAAGMAAPTLPGGNRALRPAEVLALRDGADPVTGLDLWLPPSAGGVFAFGKTKAATVQLQLTPGTEPRVARIGPFTLRSVTDPAWGATSHGFDVDIGPVDAAGTVATATATHLKPKAPRVEGMIDRTLVLFALGNASSGVVAYLTSDVLTIARSSAGVVTQEKPIETSGHLAALDAAGRAFLVWTTPDGGAMEPVQYGAILSPGAPTRMIQLGAGSEDLPCVTAGAGWIGRRDQSLSFDGTAAMLHDLPDHELVGCDATAALFRVLGRRESYSVCTPSACRQAKLAGTPERALAALAGDQVVAVGIRGPVIGVWREHGAPIFLAIPPGVTPKVAYGNARVLDVLGESAAGVVVVRVPL